MLGVIDRLIEAAHGQVSDCWVALLEEPPHHIQGGAINLLNWVQSRSRLQRDVPFPLDHPRSGNEVVKRMVLEIPEIAQIFEVLETTVQFRRSLNKSKVAEIERYVTDNFDLEVEI